MLLTFSQLALLGRKLLSRLASLLQILLLEANNKINNRFHLKTLDVFLFFPAQEFSPTRHVARLIVSELLMRAMAHSLIYF